MKDTIWTAAASSIPALSQLDMRARPADPEGARQRVEALRRRIAEGSRPFRRVRWRCRCQP